MIALPHSPGKGSESVGGAILQAKQQLNGAERFQHFCSDSSYIRWLLRHRVISQISNYYVIQRYKRRAFLRNNFQIKMLSHSWIVRGMRKQWPMLLRAA